MQHTNNIKIFDSPIFILGCTKSGTSLLRNLFDGHPALFVVPFESHFFQHIGYWVSYFFSRSRPTNLSLEQMKEQFMEWIDFSDKKVNKIADGFTAGKWDKEIFRQKLLSKPVSNLRELSDLYIESMYTSLYRKALPTGIRFVEKTVENAEFAMEWLKLYPDAKFIHIVRNPYSNLLALRKFINSKKFPFLNKGLSSMYNSYYFLYKNTNLIAEDKYNVVIYEDLITSPEKVMRVLCNFIGIEYQETLLQPSLLGEPWGGNSTSGISFSGISKLNLEKWKNDISNFEIRMVNELFAHVLRDFNFEIIKPKYSIRKIAPREGLINYLMNRLSLYYLPKLKSQTMTNEKYVNDIL